MAWHDLLYLRYAVCPTSDHAEVSRNFRLRYTDHLSHAQGICRDGEEPLDRVLFVFYQSRAGCCRDRHLGLLRGASWYDLPPFPLKKTSDANQNVESDGGSWHPA